MTGLDVLRRCAAYEKDMERLRTQRALAYDAATRITAQMGGGGGGRSQEISAKPERFALAAQWLDRRMDARRAMYALELSEAARLLSDMEPATCEALRLTMIAGLTAPQAAEAMRRTQDSVRGMLRRGRNELRQKESELPQDMDYREMDRRFKQRTPP